MKKKIIAVGLLMVASAQLLMFAAGEGDEIEPSSQDGEWKYQCGCGSSPDGEWIYNWGRGSGPDGVNFEYGSGSGQGGDGGRFGYGWGSSGFSGGSVLESYGSGSTSSTVIATHTDHF